MFPSINALVRTHELSVLRLRKVGLAPRLFDKALNHPSLTSNPSRPLSGADAAALPCSTSVFLAGESDLNMGSPDPEASPPSSSSLSSSRYGSYRGLDEDPRAKDLTTSPLQIGHVRRLVVSQGVLLCCQYAINSSIQGHMGNVTYMHSAWNS